MVTLVASSPFHQPSSCWQRAQVGDGGGEGVRAGVRADGAGSTRGADELR